MTSVQRGNSMWLRLTRPGGGGVLVNMARVNEVYPTLAGGATLYFGVVTSDEERSTDVEESLDDIEALLDGEDLVEVPAYD